MTNKLTKYGFTIIAAVLVIAMAFAGAGAATGEYVKVWNGATLQALPDGSSVSGSSGTATLTGTPGTTDPCILELNGFTVDASGTSTKIIEANVPNLTIKLVGDSKLTGGYNDADAGLIYSSGNLTITTDTDGTLVVNNTAGSYSNRNAIRVNKDLTITNGTVTATGIGTAIYISSGSITITDATVNATGSFGIYAGKDVTITNGTITATGTEDYDSAIKACAGNVTITKGTVNATATGANSKVIFADSGSITIASVDQLTVNGQGGAVAFAYDNARDFSALGNTYEYWVNEAGGSEPTVQLTYDQFNASGNWTGTLPPTKSVYTNVLIKPVSPPPTPAYVEVNSWAQLNKSVSEWTDTETALIVAVNASITDRGNGRNTEGINVTGKVILTVNASPEGGNEAIITGNTWGRLFNVTTGNLTIIGNVSTGAVLNLTGGYMDEGHGGAIYVDDGGNLTLDSYAKITNSAANRTAGYGYDNYGGAVFNNGTFIMNNGSITGCEALYGGGVENYGIFIMNGGSIADCTAEYAGGVDTYGTFIMNGGSITGCSAEEDGGGVYNNHDNGVEYLFIMNGGSITDCSAEEDGGGVANSGLFTMTGGRIASCSAPIGSGVDQYGTFNVTGSATISSDEVALHEDEGDYYNIIVDADSSFTGSIQNIKLYRYAEVGDDEYDDIVDAAAWLQQVVVENGANVANKFQLSSDHSGYQLTASGSDLILTKKAKPSSSSKDMGSTIILTEPVTPTPVPTATPAATAVPTIATVKPTAQQTQKSPAPVFGLIAGLGAAAVLLRLRK